MRKILLCIFIVILFISGCSNTGDIIDNNDEMITEIESEETEQTERYPSVTMTTPEGNVYYVMDQEDREDEAVIVLLHGLTGSHEDLIDTGKFFYNLGYAVVSFDLYGHEGDVYSSNVDISQMLQGSVEKLDNVLDSLTKENICNTEQFALYGTSLGGMVAFYMGAYGKHFPKAIITIASSPDIENVFQHALNYLRTTWSAEEKKFIYATSEEQEVLIQWAAENSPLKEMERLSNITLLMVNGTEDQYMDIDSVRSFCNEIEELGGNVYLYENEHGKHDEIGDYHAEEIASMLAECLPE